MSYRRSWGVVVASVAVLFAACSDSDSESSPDSGSAADTTLAAESESPVSTSAGTESKGSADPTAAAGDEGPGGALAMSFGGLDVPIWAQINDILQDTVQEDGYEFLSHDPQFDVQRQVQDWEGWISRGDVRVIMGYEIQQGTLDNIAEQAAEEGVIVLGYLSEFAGAEASVVLDSEGDGNDIATDVAEWVLEHYGDEDVEVGALVFQGNADAIARSKGVIDALNEKLPNATVYEIPGFVAGGGDERVQALDAVNAHLTAHPDTRIWIATTEGMALATHQALLDAGVAPDDPDTILGSLGATDEALDIMSEPGTFWRFAYTYRPQDLAAEIYALMDAAARGEAVETVFASNTRAVAGEDLSDLYSGAS